VDGVEYVRIAPSAQWRKIQAEHLGHRLADGFRKGSGAEVVVQPRV
jgi:hypothetical protein